MINICLNYDTESVDIEGEEPINFDNIELIIRKILDKACYSGERLCLETKDEGRYTEIERWH